MMKRRVFLTKGAAGVFTLGAVGCSKNDSKNPLALSSGNAVIIGMIADPGGNGVQGVSITAAGNGVSRFVVTDETGKFSIEVSQKGEYTIYPSKHGYNFNPLSEKITVNNSQSFVVNIMALMVNTKSSDIETTELGTTGIMVSRFGFGSHVSSANCGVKREYLFREAFDRGMKVFDVYDVEGRHNEYEPTGRRLAPVINDTVISISLCPARGYTPEQEIDRARELFGKDYIDMVRMHLWSPDHADFGLEWWMWEELFRLRDLGKIRAVGIPVHQMSDLEMTLETYPDDLDYVVFPYNFYHNIGWPPDLRPEFPTLAQELRAKGIGVITMKPFAGDYFINTLKTSAADVNPDLSFTQAALRYVLNSGLEPDTTFCGMNKFSEFLENIQAYYEPEISDDEYTLLDEVKAVAEKKAHAVLPEHYRFLDQWAPKPGENPEIKFV